MTTSDRHQPFPRDAMPAIESADHEWLDAVLARDAAATPYIEDDGFTAGVMAKLPARASRSPYRWIVPAMGVLGFLIGIVLLSGGENLSLNLVRLVSFDSFSMQKVLIVAM